MRHKISSQILLTLSLTFIFLISSQASAFRPSAKWLVNQAANKQLARKINTLKADYQVISYAEGDMEQSTSKLRTIYSKSPYFYAAITEDNRGESKKVKKDQKNFWRTWRTLGTKVSIDKAYQLLKRSLNAQGIHLSKVRYQRLDKHICYVIGDKIEESEDRAELWLSKDTLLPMQISWFEETNGKNNFYQLKLTAWNSPQGGEWLPQNMYLYKNHHLLEESHLNHIERNIHIDSKIFSMQN